MLVHLLRLDFQMTREIRRILRQGRDPSFSGAGAVLSSPRSEYLFYSASGAALCLESISFSYLLA